MTEAPTEDRAPSPRTKLLIEFGPLILFFAVNLKAGIMWGTGVLMVAMLVSLTASWRIERRLPPMGIVTGVFVLVFGGLTIYFDDELFIKLKLTIVNLMFATALACGLLMRKMPLKVLLGSSLRLTDAGWKVMTGRWILFFLFLAAANEMARKQLSTDDWVTFKVFGVLGATLVFSFTLLPLMHRHQLPEDQDTPAAE